MRHKPTNLSRLRTRLAAAEETLRAVRADEVDTVVVAGKKGPQVFTLQGAEHAYRMLIESMNEGALTLTADKMILYANQCFARMVQCPLEQVIGNSFRRFLSTEDLTALHRLIKQSGSSGAKIQALLKAGNGSNIVVQISVRPLAKSGSDRATLGVVVTDMTEVRRSEKMLRALSHSVVQAQETERGRVARELHDHITQLLCAILVHSQTLVNNLTVRGPAKREALKLRALLGQAAEEVERISRDLRPSVLAELGLSLVLRDTSTKFAARTGVSVKLAGVQLTARLPAATELALYRIFQEALKNVEQHAHAQQVTVRLTQLGDCVQLVITDDGVGFDLEQPDGKGHGPAGLGLISMRERATYLGGAVEIKSIQRAGTAIAVRIPLPLGHGVAHGVDL